MQWHIRILAVLYIGGGILAGCLLGIETLQSSGTFWGPALGEFSGALGAALSTLAALLTLAALSLAALLITSGVGLLGMRSWSRTMSIVTAMILLPAVPIGAAATLYMSPLPVLAIGASIGALGLYGLWVLLNRKTQLLFPPVRVETSA
jgi:hypothetical protein